MAESALASTRVVTIEVAPGELIDKITILRIKSERIVDAAKLANVRAELASLEASQRRSLPASAALDGLTAELKAINETLWDIENVVRRHERDHDFGAGFVEAARAVYVNNDRRAACKRRINELLGAAFMEEKDYAKYN